MKKRLVGIAVLLLRVALAVAFLSAVADRLGLWGPAGTGGVEWGLGTLQRICSQA